MHEWCLDSEADAEVMSKVKKANPASWHTVKTLKRRHDSPSMTPWQWLRFACGIWTEGDEPWMQAAQWDRLAQEWTPNKREPVWLGLDTGIREEPAAIVIVARREQVS